MAATKSTDMMDVLMSQDIIFDKIFPLLDMKDIFQLRATNKKHHDMVMEYFKGQKKVVIDGAALMNFKPKEGCPRPINIMAASTGKVTHLEIQMPTDGAKRVKGPRYESLKEFTVRRDKEEAERKRKADKYWLEPSDIYNFLEINPCLETLVLTNLGSRTIDRELLVNLQMNCPNLKRLEIHDCFGWPNSLNLMDIEDKNFPAVTHFVVENSVIPDGLLCVMISKMPELKELVLANLKYATDKVVFTLAEWNQLLRHLSVQCCYGITDSGLQIALEYLPQLKKLTLAPVPTAKGAKITAANASPYPKGKQPYTDQVVDIIRAHGVEVKTCIGNPEAEGPEGYTSDESDD